MAPTLAELAAELAGWDKSAAGAERLRSRLTGSKLTPAEPRSVFERAIQIARSAQERRRPPERARLADDPELAAAFAPFLGDPAMGSWPFDDPLLVDDDEAALWLPLLALHAVIDDRHRELVTVLHRVRRRELWVPASYAFAALAARDRATRDMLAAAFARAFPKGLPERWGPRLLQGAPSKGRTSGRDARPPGGTSEADDAHAARHLLHAACAYLAAGGELGGIDAGRIAAMALPTDDTSDASAALLALRALAGGASTRAALVEHVAARAREAPAAELCDAALRSLAEGLDAAGGAEREARRAIENRLREPRWIEAPPTDRFDALWSWLGTARWFAARGDQGAVAEMRGAAAEGESAFRLALEGALPDGGDAALAVLPRLATVLDADRWATTPARRRDVLLVELILLLERPEVAAMAWPALVRRASPGAPPALEGNVGDVAKMGLAIALGAHRVHPRFLLREARFDEAIMLHLAPFRDGFVARQVAVDVERLLREAAREAPRGNRKKKARGPEVPARTPGDAQARLLWRLFQRNPPTVTFRELGRVLRGSDTPLHGVVSSLHGLDCLRDELEDVAGMTSEHASRIAAAYAEVARAMKQLAEGAADGAPSVRMVASVADALGAAARLEPADVGSPEWLDAVRRVILDRGGEAWIEWSASASTALDERWSRFHAAARAAEEAGAWVAAAQCDELEAATAALEMHLQGLTWPETNLLRRALHQVGLRLGGWRADVRERAASSARVVQLLDRGDEAAVIDLVHRADDPTLERLGAEELRRVARFLLLRLRYHAAARLRARVAKRVQLPGPLAYVAPLFVGVSSGTFLVLDVGTAWNDVVGSGHPIQYAATVAIALLLTFALLAGNVSMLMPREDGAGRASWLVRIGWRVMPTYAAAFALALAISSVVLWTLQGTANSISNGHPIPFLPEVFLWASLSLFLGVFLGLVLQGRGTFREG